MTGGFCFRHGAGGVTPVVVEVCVVQSVDEGCDKQLKAIGELSKRYLSAIQGIKFVCTTL